MQELKKPLEDRVGDIERALSEIVGCLGLMRFQSPDGRVGYTIKKQGSSETWGILVKIASELEQLKDQKRIIIPGR